MEVNYTSKICNRKSKNLGRFDREVSSVDEDLRGRNVPGFYSSCCGFCSYNWLPLTYLVVWLAMSLHHTEGSTSPWYGKQRFVVLLRIAASKHTILQYVLLYIYLSYLLRSPPPNLVYCVYLLSSALYTTSIEARLRRASLRRRAGNGARVTALRWRWFGDSAYANVHVFMCSNARPCNDGAPSQGKQGNMTVVHSRPCHVSAPSNSASNEQWG